MGNTPQGYGSDVSHEELSDETHTRKSEPGSSMASKNTAESNNPTTQEDSSVDDKIIIENVDVVGEASGIREEHVRVDIVDVILQNNRREITDELRQLTHTETAVSQSDNERRRTAVADLLQRRINPQSTQEPEPTDEVRVEIQSLIQSRPVSNLLQTAEFRSSLERIIADGFFPASQSRAPVYSRNNARAIPPPPPPPIPSTNNANRSRRPVRTHNHPVVSPTNTLRQPRDPARVPPVSEEQRSEIISDISSLVHRHLVSSTLNSNVRDRLEQNVADRLARMNFDGERVRQFIRSLPPSGIQRNDFSQFGLNDAHINDTDSLDSISVINATAAVHVNNSKLYKELDAMKSQIATLTSLMQKQTELQLETQRAIRQELSAALANQQFKVPVPFSLPSKPLNSSCCIICVDNKADCVMYKCGHIATCWDCSTRLKSQGGKCPVCRAPIVDILKVYQCILGS